MATTKMVKDALLLSGRGEEEDEGTCDDRRA